MFLHHMTEDEPELPPLPAEAETATTASDEEHSDPEEAWGPD
jgi:hypothetical protein